MRITSGSLAQAVPLESAVGPKGPGGLSAFLSALAVLAYGAAIIPIHQAIGTRGFALAFAVVILIAFSSVQALRSER